MVAGFKNALTALYDWIDDRRGHRAEWPDDVEGRFVELEVALGERLVVTDTVTDERTGAFDRHYDWTPL